MAKTKIKKQSLIEYGLLNNEGNRIVGARPYFDINHMFDNWLVQQLPMEVKMFGKFIPLTLKYYCGKWEEELKITIARHEKVKKSKLRYRFLHLYEDELFLKKLMEKYQLPNWVKECYAKESQHMKHPFEDECGQQLTVLRLQRQ